MKYLKLLNGTENWKEVSYTEALDTLLTTYKDNDITREMLTIPGEIPCKLSFIRVI